MSSAPSETAEELVPEDFFPSSAIEATVHSPFFDVGSENDTRYIASADRNVGCDLKRKEFHCGVLSYLENETYGTGNYAPNFLVNSTKDEVFDANDLGATALYGLKQPDPSHSPAPQIVQPGEIVNFDGNYCQGLEDGLMCWNVSTKTGRTMQRDGVEFWTFEF